MNDRNVENVSGDVSDVCFVAFSQLFTGKKLAAEAKEAKLRLGQGTHKVDCTVRLQGSLVIEASLEYTPTADVSLKLVMALLLQRSGNQRGKAASDLIEIMETALRLQGDEEAQLALLGEYMADVDAALARVKEFTSKLPKKTRAGGTKLAVAIERLTPEAEGAEVLVYRKPAPAVVADAPSAATSS